MFISHSWLKTYIDHDLNPEALGELITFQACPVEDIEHLEAGDACLELEVTFNRADLLGHIGVAKEVAAGLAKSITEPVILLEESSAEQAVKLASVFVEAKDLCPRYTARVIRGVKIGPSPAWLQQRLEAIGVRPVNNVVDVTNFVLHECGQPLHAFDFATLKGAEIVVRRGREGETITAIDGTSYSLTRDTLVIADQERPVAIAGIMGGQDTEISGGTTDILLESAYFDPVCTRRAVRRLGLRSDSSHRFERGVDPERVEWASRRAAQLISEDAGGQVAAGFVDADAGTLPGPQTISLRLDRLDKIAGFPIAARETKQILHGLGMRVGKGGLMGLANEVEQLGKDLMAQMASIVKGVAGAGGAGGDGHGDPPADESTHGRELSVTVPTARFEVTREIDLIEEVLRVHGYDKVPEAEGLPIAVSPVDPRQAATERIQAVLVGAGYREIHTLSFVADDPIADPPLFTDRPALKVKNPVRQETPALRRSLFSPLLEVKALNLSRGFRELKVFEVSTVYLPGWAPGHLEECAMLGALADDDFFGVKGALEGVGEALGLADALCVEPIGKDDPGAAVLATIFDPLERAAVVLRAEGESAERRVGWLARLGKTAAKRFGLGRARPVMLLVDLEPVFARATLSRSLEKASVFPPVARDLAAVVPSEGPYVGNMLETVRALGQQLPVLRKVELVSVFEGDGKSLPEGHKSVAIRMTCRSFDRTLRGEEADEVREAAKTALAGAFAATFRE